MNHVWVLVMVTALTPFDYEVKPLAQTNTMAECYFQSTVTEFDITKDINKELLCIRVDEEID